MFAGYLRTAWESGTAVAVAAGVVGFFVVFRRAAFAAHALPSGAFAGAAAANLLGVDTLTGLGVASLAGAVGIGRAGRRARRDVVTALVLVLALALGDLLLSRTAVYGPSVYSLLFGEILGVSPGDVVPITCIAAACVVATALLWRPLLLTSLAPDLAEARGVRGDLVDLAFLVVLAALTASAVPVVGSLLVFSLLTGPPAAARAVTARPAVAAVVSVAFALATVWGAIAASYWSNLPVGFYIGTFGALAYALGRAVTALR